MVSDTSAIVSSPFIINEFEKKFFQVLIFPSACGFLGNLLVFVSFKNSLTVIIKFYGSFHLSLHIIFFPSANYTTHGADED